MADTKKPIPQEESGSSEKKEIRLDIPKEVQVGVYADDLFCSRSRLSFTLTFIKKDPLNATRVDAVARIILHPMKMKEIAHLLIEQIKGYEIEFGEIK